MSSLRARLGYLVTPNLLAYGAGGVAWSKFDYAANNNAGVGSPCYTSAARQCPRWIIHVISSEHKLLTLHA